MDAEWVFRGDDGRSALPEPPRPRLDALAHAARSRLGGDAPVKFLRCRRFAFGWHAVAGIGFWHAIARAASVGATADGAVAACCDGIDRRLGLLADAAGSLSERPPVHEFVLRTWRIPAVARAPSLAAVEPTREEQFLYNLTDEEALVRAGLSGEPFFFYGTRGQCVTNVLVRTGGSWHRVRDVERPAWMLPLADGPVTVQPEPADGGAPLPPVRFTRDSILRAPTLSAALEHFARGGPPLLSVALEDDGITGFLARDGAGARLVGYHGDIFALDAETGPFGVPTWARARAPRVSKGKRLKEVLACPDCRVRLDAASLARRACPACGKRFQVGPTSISFSDDEHRVVSEAEASRNTPSKQLAHDLRLHPDGLVLNIGAGDTPLAADNLVNLDIEAYRTTDVVADARRLPFTDGAFDVVFSQSVLEHVPDPFECAREMQRVLRPGGTLYADVPFVGPFHGYPDHYFNMTMNGLRQLFGALSEIDVREGPHHAPAIAVLSLSFHAMIRDPAARARMAAMPLGEIFEALRTGRDPAISRDLDPAKTFEISAGFAFYGRKPEVTSPDREARSRP